jgi:adenylate cyclase
MPLEIERKFLVIAEDWRALARRAQRCRQGYLSRPPGLTVRVRRMGETASLTVKGPRDGIAREEFEYPIPVQDAEAMLRLCTTPLVRKVRHEVPCGGRTWVVDEYQGRAKGLVVAEVELDAPDEAVEAPGWLGAEVTHDMRYRNWAIAMGALLTSAARPTRKPSDPRSSPWPSPFPSASPA